MPAIHRYKVTVTRTVQVTTAFGEQTAHDIGQRAVNDNAPVQWSTNGSSGIPITVKTKIKRTD